MGSRYGVQLSTLASGILLGQAITLLASPLLTRLYNPVEFSGYAVFLALTSAITPALNGRYEIAIVVTRSDDDSRSFLAICVWVTTLVAAIYFLSLAAFRPFVESFLHAKISNGWLVCVTVLLLAVGWSTALKYWANRQGEFGIIGRQAAFQSFTIAALSIVLSVTSLGHYGLILATILGTMAGLGFFAIAYRKVIPASNFALNNQHVILARKNYDYPLYNATTSLLDGVTLVLPVLFFTNRYDGVMVAYFVLVTRVAMAPLSFISQAVSQIHLKHMSDLINDGADPRRYMALVSTALTAVAIPPALILIASSAWLFGAVFGENWAGAGPVLVLLAPSIIVKFVVSTVSGVFASTGHNALSAIWKIVAFSTTIALLYFSPKETSFHSMVSYLVVLDVVLYSMYFILAWYAITHPRVQGPCAD
jgi:O-antigen/teichoic acid export membrane protein